MLQTLTETWSIAGSFDQPLALGSTGRVSRWAWTRRRASALERCVSYDTKIATCNYIESSPAILQFNSPKLQIHYI